MSVVNSFVVSRIDYCNCLLVGFPRYQLDRLQAVMYNAARLIFGIGKCNITASSTSFGTVYIGCQFQSASTSSCVCWRSRRSLASRHLTWQTCDTRVNHRLEMKIAFCSSGQPCCVSDVNNATSPMAIVPSAKAKAKDCPHMFKARPRRRPDTTKHKTEKHHWHNWQ